MHHVRQRFPCGCQSTAIQTCDQSAATGLRSSHRHGDVLEERTPGAGRHLREASLVMIAQIVDVETRHRPGGHVGPRPRLVIIPTDLVGIVAPLVYIFDDEIVAVTQYEGRHFRMGVGVDIQLRCEIRIGYAIIFVAPDCLPPFAVPTTGGYVLRVCAYSGHCEFRRPRGGGG